MNLQAYSTLVLTTVLLSVSAPALAKEEIRCQAFGACVNGSTTVVEARVGEGRNPAQAFDQLKLNSGCKTALKGGRLSSTVNYICTSKWTQPSNEIPRQFPPRAP